MTILGQLGESDEPPIPPPFAVNVIDGSPYQIVGLTMDVESVQTTVQWSETVRITLGTGKDGRCAIHVNGVLVLEKNVLEEMR